MHSARVATHHQDPSAGRHQRPAPIEPKVALGQAQDGRSAVDRGGPIGKEQIRLTDRRYDGDSLHLTLMERSASADMKPIPNRENAPPSASPFIATAARLSFIK